MPQRLISIPHAGRLLEFEPALRPLIALRGGRSRGFAIDCGLRGERSARTVLRRLAASDVERIDLAALDAGLRAFGDRDSVGRAAMLVMPAAFETFASRRGRIEVLERAVHVRKVLHAAAILEVTTLPANLPASRLVELIGQVRPSCNGVFVRIRPGRADIKAVDGCTLNGVAMEACDLPDPEDEAAMVRLLLVLRGVGPTTILHNLRTMAAIQAARTAGATYASLDIAKVGEEVT